MQTLLKRLAIELGRDKSDLEILKLYLSGDHDKLEWRGVIPEKDRENDLERDKTIDDQISPAIARIVAGVMGRDFEYSGKMQDSDVSSSLVAEAEADPPPDPPPSAETLALACLLKEAEDAMTGWHYDASVLETVQQGITFEQALGYTIYRVYIPDEYSVLDPYAPEPEEGQPDTRERLEKGSLSTLAEALERIHFDALDPTCSGVIRDAHKREIGFYYSFTKEDVPNRTYVEVHTPKEIRLYSYEGKSISSETLLVPERRADGKEWVDPNPLFDPARIRKPRYMMVMLRRTQGSTITRSVRDAQDRLNENGTYMARNEKAAGAPQFIFENANTKVPKLLPDGTQARDPETGDPLFEEAEITTGAGTHIKLVGQPIYDEAGNVRAYAAPNSKRLEPLNPEQNLIPGAKEWRGRILKAYDQVWTEASLLSVSGISRQEARIPFERRLVLESAPIIQALRELLGVVFDLARWLVAGGDRFAGITWEPKLYLDVSPASLDLFRALIEGYRENVVAVETIVENYPVPADVQKIMRALERQKAARDAESETQATSVLEAARQRAQQAAQDEVRE